MLFEVDFVEKRKSNFITIYTALIYAHTLHECRELANEIAVEKKIKAENLFIQELIITET